MAKLSKTTLTVIVTAGVVLVLGGILLILMLTEPKEREENSSQQTSSGSSHIGENSANSENSSIAADKIDDEQEKLKITDKAGENVLTLEISNETGNFSFERQSRMVSKTAEDGTVTTTKQYFWTSPQLKGINHNESSISAFMNSMASVTAYSVVEENAEKLDKYGLSQPLAAAKISFDDGTSKELCFGIKNPAAETYVYFCEKGSTKVMLAGYYNIGSVFYDVKDFVNLILTESYNANDPKELDFLKITRKDLEQPIEIEYMPPLENDDEGYLSSFNTHRITSPIAVEVDTVTGKTVCYGVYGLTASDCVYIDPTEQELNDTGLSDPFCTVSFSYGGKARVLLLGNKVSSVDSSELTSVTGYYAMFEGERQIFEISTSNAPWYDCNVGEIMSRRPVSPYIYTVDTLTVTTPEKEYVFKVNGDADNHSFTYGEQELSDSSFKGFYQHLITAIGEELYFSEEKPAPYITVKFTYRSEYRKTYGRAEDIIEFYKSDDRKNIIAVNGDILFKVREIYTQRLLDNLNALLNGGEIKLDW